MECSSTSDIRRKQRTFFETKTEVSKNLRNLMQFGGLEVIDHVRVRYIYNHWDVSFHKWRGDNREQKDHADAYSLLLCHLKKNF